MSKKVTVFISRATEPSQQSPTLKVKIKSNLQLSSFHKVLATTYPKYNNITVRDITVPLYNENNNSPLFTADTDMNAIKRLVIEDITAKISDRIYGTIEEEDLAYINAVISAIKFDYYVNAGLYLSGSLVNLK